MSVAVTAHIGLGANLGDAQATLRAVLPALDTLPQTRLLAASRLYHTPAWGRLDQPAFVNAAAAISTTLTAEALLDALLALERSHGRERIAGERWGPRTLDLDVLLFGDQVIDTPRLQVPHPHLHERAFALLPLAEIAADAVIAGHGTVQAALAKLDTGGLVPIG
ncbi:MAG TPA: 2-amino-4-hydroxy-6-hydroxymethyldihydropteridine diphosphokinase [Stenotrophomonas sp.]|nr:2-amino-4-hydroxy-6-hydroxymethyldihydropteridine diphosphokinase [Stenotrophomonas sp.]